MSHVAPWSTRLRGERTVDRTGPGRWLYGCVTTTTADQLTASDRCDRCGAQAYVRVTLESGQLYFCAHHGRALTPAMTEIALEILDESDRLHATSTPDAR